MPPSSRQGETADPDAHPQNVTWRHQASSIWVSALAFKKAWDYGAACVASEVAAGRTESSLKSWVAMAEQQLHEPQLQREGIINWREI